MKSTDFISVLLEPVTEAGCQQLVLSKPRQYDVWNCTGSAMCVHPPNAARSALLLQASMIVFPRNYIVCSTVAAPQGKKKKQ
ncbi:hypothetical protein V6N12_040619 [Hibiscus sabdariffa]|uniref:Uncharacterized protein n=1 Tax=Hibiscus sabdariffa TaxID=183260 RepID=A0ABR2E484_9ROSI